ncbi:MAG: DUF167 domain-containing protein [Thermodesulfobacteriota bacterium]
MNDLVLTITVLPRSSAAKIMGFKGDALKVKVKSAPVDGSANRDLIDMLSRHLKVPKKRIEILKGHTARRKIVKFHDISMEELRRSLSA